MNRSNVVAMIALAVVLAGLGVAYVAWASNRVDEDIAAREARALEAIEDFEPANEAVVDGEPEVIEEPGAADEPDRGSEPVAEQDRAADQIEPGSVMAINRVPGDDYGRVVVLRADGTRELLERRCERLHVAAGVGICVSQQESFGFPTFTSRFLDATDTGLQEVRSYPSPQPSRARVSPAGTLVSTTAFVSGSSYADVGSDAETLAVVDEVESSINLRGLVEFEIVSPDEKYEGVVGQYWGVSFVDEDNFWVTGFFGDGPEVFEGSMSRGVLTPSGLIGSCPSVSPDGSTLVYKQARADDEGFDLVAVDLASGDSWQLGETRSVDDQVEWLDDDTILYALHADLSEEGDASVAQPQFDIWLLDVAPGSEPTLFLPAADSPAAIRP